MLIEASFGVIQEEKSDAIALGVFQGKERLDAALSHVDTALNGQIGRLMAKGVVTGKTGEVSVIHPDGRIPARLVILVGVGKPQNLDRGVLRRASALATKKARELGAETVSTALHTLVGQDLSGRTAAEAVAQGAVMGLYRFAELKTVKPDRPDTKRFTLVESDPSKIQQVTQGAKAGQIVGESVCFARDLTNLPANALTPFRMSEIAQSIAGICNLKVTILDQADITKLGMNAFLSVARGSHNPPRFIVLEHNQGKADLPAVALVGKAVTFDSGGISLKPGAGMEAMKGDMAGGAAVLGAIRAAALLNLPIRVVGLIPATENMPGGGASRPGDVEKSMKGLTIEIISTDAEGRLCLADALTYAKEYSPDAIFDIATLTGACSVALGSGAAGVMGDEKLTILLQEAGSKSGDRVWPLPLFEEYQEQIKSDVADVKNSGGRPAGASTAGCFLQRFVPDGVPWAHIDMAGVSMESKGTPETPKGAAGYGVALFVELLRNWR